MKIESRCMDVLAQIGIIHMFFDIYGPFHNEKGNHSIIHSVFELVSRYLSLFLLSPHAFIKSETIFTAVLFNVERKKHYAVKSHFFNSKSLKGVI